MKNYFVSVLIILFAAQTLVFAQKQPAKYSYEAHKKFIPAELGKVYLGMPFDKFARQIDLSRAEVGDTGFDWLQLKISLEKGNITTATIRIYGLTQEEKSEIVRVEKIKEKEADGFEYEREIQKLEVDKIPAKGFVYAIYLDFKKEFDLKTYVVKTYGKDGEVRKSDDKYHFYDIQWSKKTADSLLWMIRSFHESDNRKLQLLGRINGTEWGLEDLR